MSANFDPVPRKNTQRCREWQIESLGLKPLKEGSNSIRRQHTDVETEEVAKVCMIFKTTREPVKQIGVWLGIVMLLPLSTWYGTSTYSPPPDEKEYSKATSRLRDQIEAADDNAEKEKLRKEKERVEAEYEEATRVFYRDMFWVAYPVGLLAVIFGLLFTVQPVGGGFFFGGLITLGTGCYSYWDRMETWHHFLSLLLVLLVLAVLGSWRFWPSSSKPELPPSATAPPPAQLGSSP